MARYLYSELASAIQARLNCEKSNNQEWHERWTERIDSLMAKHAPSGSGFDNGTRIHTSGSHADKLVFFTAFHHMDDGGGYSGWTEHKVTVTPSFCHRFHIRVSGPNRNEIKDFIGETFAEFLRTELPDAPAPRDTVTDTDRMDQTFTPID